MRHGDVNGLLVEGNMMGVGESLIGHGKCSPGASGRQARQVQVPYSQDHAQDHV